MSGEPQGSKDDVFDQLNDPRLLRRAQIVAAITAAIALALFALWYFH